MNGRLRYKEILILEEFLLSRGVRPSHDRDFGPDYGGVFVPPMMSGSPMYGNPMYSNPMGSVAKNSKKHVNL